MIRSIDSSRHTPMFSNMKTRLTLLSVSILATAHAASAAGPTIPQRPPPDAFQKLTEDWPFALATPVVAPEAPKAGWASNYYVGGIGKNYESGKEEVFVAVKSKDGQASFSLYGNQPNADDISIGGIEWSESIGKSRVTLKKGSEFQTIEFDQVALQTPIPQQPNGLARPGMPNMPAVKQPMIRPPGAPGVPGGTVPRPTNLPQGNSVPLPGPSNTNAAPMPGNMNAAPNGNVPKQRVRVIKSTP